MVLERKNAEIPQKGGLIRFASGLIGEVLSVEGGSWGKVEAMVNGTRVYADVADIEVVNVLERIVMEL